ncbi:hypothetical protein [Streptomyces olivochromogenes]|uniref:hypothetical protein n=1 Tax=Streptomyces olivochromogenes TaxID=1963 RepID=UPI001F272A96|nr:hypothetical protein [Streptomyces olivochromogenes]
MAAPGRWLRDGRLSMALLVAGIAVFQTGLWVRPLPLFVIDPLLAGTGVGLGGSAVDDFLAAYASTIVPTLALGLLDQILGQDIATSLLSVAVAVTTLATARRRPAAPHLLHPRKEQS